MRVGLVQLIDLLDEVVHRAFLELRHADPAVARFHDLGAHRLGADLLAGDRHREAAVLVLAVDGERDLGVRLAAHALHGIAQRQPLHHRLVDLGDQVIRLEPGAVGRRALDRRDHLHQAVFLRDLDADAHETARRAFAEFLERLLVEILGVRIQPGDHAGNGVADQLLLVDRFDVIALDHAEHRRQLLQFFQRQWRQGATGDCLQRHSRQRAGQCAYGNPAGNLQFVAHVKWVQSSGGSKIYTVKHALTQRLRAGSPHSRDS